MVRVRGSSRSSIRFHPLPTGLEKPACRSIFIVLFVLLSLLLSAWVPPQEKRVIRAGLYENPPKIYTDENGNAAGFWPAILNSIADEEGWQIVWVPGTWDENLARLESGEIDILPDVGWTQARSELYTFSTGTVLVSWARLYVPPSSSIETILDLEGKKVAGLAGSVNFDGPEGIKVLASNFGVNCTFIGMSSYDEVFAALQNREVDAGVANKDFGDQNESRYNVAHTAVLLAPTSLRFAFPKDGEQTAYLLQTIDADLVKFKNDQNSIYYSALDEYLADNTVQTIVKVIPQWVYLVIGNAAWVILLLAIVVWISRRQVSLRTASLRASEEHNRELVENIPDLLFRLNKKGDFLDVDGSIDVPIFTARSQLIGKNLDEFFPTDLAFTAHEKIDKAVETGNMQIHELNWNFNGSEYDLEARVCKSKTDEVLVVVRDITEQKKAGRELRESEERYITLSQVAPVGIFRTDREGSTTYVNPTWCQISGLRPDEALGNGWLKAVHPDDIEIVQKNWQDSAHSNRISYADYRFVHPDGSISWVMGQAVPEKDVKGNVVGYIGTVTDITERKKVQELEVAVMKAESADRLKSAFLATMSHELRTPLNSIIGFTGILLQRMVGSLSDEQDKQLRMIQGSANHLLNLINDVLDISKIEAGQMPVANEPFDFKSSVDSCLAKIKPLAEKKGLELIETVPFASLEIIGDRRRVEQILLNLLSNAVKFTERGSVWIDCSVKKNTLTTRVIDTGIGIRKEDLVLLFKPFSQVETGLTRKYEGTGLGLSICRHLVGLLGGRISVKSEPGKGSEFSFTLPLKRGGK
jgi:PAS domain S-box-containing protein